MLDLPPLDSLRFFEAAARHESFVLAGKELGVTPPAVAHRIRMLEDHLGAACRRREMPGGRRAVRMAGRIRFGARRYAPGQRSTAVGQPPRRSGLRRDDARFHGVFVVSVARARPCAHRLTATARPRRRHDAANPGRWNDVRGRTRCRCRSARSARHPSCSR